MTSTSDDDGQFDVDFHNEYILRRERRGWTVTSPTWTGELPRLDATSLLRVYRLDEPFPIPRRDAGTPMGVAHRLEVLEAMIRELLERHAPELLVEIYRDPSADAIEELVNRMREREGLRVRVTSKPNRVERSAT